jgi:hypothetical protein
VTKSFAPGEAHDGVGVWNINWDIERFLSEVYCRTLCREGTFLGIFGSYHRFVTLHHSSAVSPIAAIHLVPGKGAILHHVRLEHSYLLSE